jgi:hypothetical protein
MRSSLESRPGYPNPIVWSIVINDIDSGILEPQVEPINQMIIASEILLSLHSSDQNGNGNGNFKISESEVTLWEEFISDLKNPEGKIIVNWSIPENQFQPVLEAEFVSFLIKSGKTKHRLHVPVVSLSVPHHTFPYEQITRFRYPTDLNNAITYIIPKMHEINRSPKTVMLPRSETTQLIDALNFDNEISNDGRSKIIE